MMEYWHQEIAGWFRSGTANPSQWLVDWVHGGETTASGERITASSALAVSAVWRAVQLISGDVAKVPVHIYKRRGSGKERDAGHPAEPLIRYRWSPFVTAFRGKQLLTHHALMHGNGYAHIVRRGAQPVELVPLPHDTAFVEERNDTAGTVTYWYVCRVGNETFRFEPSTVLHLRGLSPDGITGYSMIGKARESIGLTKAAEKYGAVFFKNHGLPGVILRFPGHLSADDIEKIGKSWERAHSGVSNAHRAAVLDKAGDISTLAVNNEQAQFLQTRQFQIREVANWFGIPPHMIGDTTRTSYASIEAESKSYLATCLDYWFTAWEDELRDKLLTEAEKAADTHVVEFQRAKLIATDTSTEHAVLVQDVNNGLLTLDEARAMLNRPEVPDGLGAKHRIPVNIAELGAAEPAAPEADADAMPEAVRAMATATATRMVHRVTTAARAAGRKPERLDEYLAAMRGEHVETLAEAFAPVVAMARGVSLGDGRAIGRQIADAMVRTLGMELVNMSGVHTADTFGAAVAQWCDGLDSNRPAALAAELLGDTYNERT